MSEAEEVKGESKKNEQEPGNNADGEKDTENADYDLIKQMEQCETEDGKVEDQNQASQRFG